MLAKKKKKKNQVSEHVKILKLPKALVFLWIRSEIIWISYISYTQNKTCT